MSHKLRPRRQAARQQVQGCEGDRQGAVAPGGRQQERHVVTSPTGHRQWNSLASVPWGHPHPQGRRCPAEVQPCREGGARCFSRYQPGLSSEDSAGPYAQEQRSIPKSDQQHSCPNCPGTDTLSSKPGTSCFPRSHTSLVQHLWPPLGALHGCASWQDPAPHASLDFLAALHSCQRVQEAPWPSAFPA